MSENLLEYTTVEDPRGEGRTEVSVQRRHRARFDVALEPRAHDVLVAGPELLDERRELPEVVRAVGVSHHHIVATNEREGVDVGAPEPALGRAQHPRPARQGALRRFVRAAVDDQDLAAHAGVGQALLAPPHELIDRDLLVERRDDDRQLGIADVIVWDQQLNFGRPRQGLLDKRIIGEQQASRGPESAI